MIDTSGVDFDAVPDVLRQISEFLRKLVADVPDPLGAEPDEAAIEAVNTYLERQRELREVSLPTDLQAEDLRGVVETMASEVNRLGNIEAEGLDIDNGPGGIVISVPEE